MAYALVSFQDINYSTLDISGVSRLANALDVLNDIVSGNHFSVEVQEEFKKIDLIINKMKVYVDAQDKGLCTKHSTTPLRKLRSSSSGCH